MKQTLSEDAWLASVGKHRGVAIRILDIIEEMLESKGIMIPDEDRTGDESEACLYGMTYADLENAIEEVLGRYYHFNYSLLRTSDPVFLSSTTKLKKAALLTAAKHPPI